jgi:hypothetical protein
VVTIPSSAAPTGVAVASPDAAGDTTIPFTYAGGMVSVTLPTLEAYSVVIVSY